MVTHDGKRLLNLSLLMWAQSFGCCRKHSDKSYELSLLHSNDPQQLADFNLSFHIKTYSMHGKQKRLPPLIGHISIISSAFCLNCDMTLRGGKWDYQRGLWWGNSWQTEGLIFANSSGCFCRGQRVAPPSGVPPQPLSAELRSVAPLSTQTYNLKIFICMKTEDELEKQPAGVHLRTKQQIAGTWFYPPRRLRNLNSACFSVCSFLKLMVWHKY